MLQKLGGVLVLQSLVDMQILNFEIKIALKKQKH